MGNYEYEFIMKEYNKAKEIAEENIGLDSHTGKFTVDESSIDLKVISNEIERMFDVGRKVGKLFPNGNILSTAKNMATVKDYRKAVDAISKYVNTTIPELVNMYDGENILLADETETVPLHARTVINDLFNAFNHGIVSAYNKNDFWPYTEMFSTRKVTKNSLN